MWHTYSRSLLVTLCKYSTVHMSVSDSLDLLDFSVCFLPVWRVCTCATSHHFSAPFSASSLPGALQALVSLMWCPVSLKLFSHVFLFFFLFVTLIRWITLSLSSLSLSAASCNMRVNPSSTGLVQCGFIFCSVFLVFIQIGQLAA